MSAHLRKTDWVQIDDSKETPPTVVVPEAVAKLMVDRQLPNYQTTVRIELKPLGYGTELTLTDGPFDLRVPGVLDAYAEANEGWGEALAWLRGWVDFSVELRPRR